MEQIEVSISWNEATQQWRMLDGDGRFIQEFFDCDNIHKVFKRLGKQETKRYLLNAKIIQ